MLQSRRLLALNDVAIFSSPFDFVDPIWLFDTFHYEVLVVVLVKRCQ